MRYIFLILFVGFTTGESWFGQYGVSKNDVFTSMIKSNDGGYILLGTSNTLGNGRNDIWVVRTDDSLNFIWQRFYGGPLDDLGKYILQQKDGFIIIGQTISSSSNNIRILKIDKKGKKLWDNIYESKFENIAHSIEEIESVGFLITGEEEVPEKNKDGFIMLIDYSGKNIWKETLGGNRDDGLFRTRTMNNGYLCIGYTNSFRNSGLKVPETTFLKRFVGFFIKPKISQEVWLVRLDNKRKKIWEKTYGGNEQDIGHFVFAQGDSAYFIIGSTNSFGNKKGDAWVIKTNNEGNEIWNNLYGGPNKDELNDAIQISKGNILLTLNSLPKKNFFKKTNYTNTRNVLINSDGDSLWDKTYAIDFENNINKIFFDSENRIINIGYKIIPQEKDLVQFVGLSNVAPSKERKEAWIFDIDTLGSNIQEYIFSGDRSEYGLELLENGNSDFMVLANMNSYHRYEHDISLLTFDYFGRITNTLALIEDGDQSGRSFYRKSDGGIVIIGETYSAKYAGIDLLIKSYDESGKKLWENEYGAFGDDIGVDVIESNDGGSIIVGKTSSFGKGGTDAWLIKVDQDGQEEWSRSFGGKSLDGFASIENTSDGNYIISGSNLSNSISEDIWVMILDNDGENVWERTYGSFYDDRGISAKEVSSGGFVVLGQSQNNIKGHGKDILVIGVDKTGEQIWSTEIGGIGDQIPYAICVLKDSEKGFVIIGETESKDGTSKISLMNINPLGEIVWERLFGGGYISVGCSIIDDGSGLFVMGNLDVDRNGNSDICIFKTDYNGMILEY